MSTKEHVYGSTKEHVYGEVDSAGDLKRIFARYIRFSAEFPDFFRMMTHENLVESKRLTWLVKNHLEPTTKHMTDLIRRAQHAAKQYDPHLSLVPRPAASFCAKSRANRCSSKSKTGLSSPTSPPSRA